MPMGLKEYTGLMALTGMKDKMKIGLSAIDLNDEKEN